MKFHIILHENFEAPAAIMVWASLKQHTLSFTRLYEGEFLPSVTSDFDCLIIMGGPQSPATTCEECSYFDARREIDFIKAAIEADKAVLGICLGAQLLGEALGARFERSPNREIGVFDVILTEAGKKDPYFSGLPDRFPVGHWHGDMPGLTSAAEILAYSEGCPRQIVRYAPKVYGFQCHLEFTIAAMVGMNDNCSAELEAYKGLPYIQDAQTLVSHDYTEMNGYLFGFLDFLESMQIGNGSKS